MINLIEISNNFPMTKIGTEWVNGRNVVELVREDGTGCSFNAVVVIGNQEHKAYLRFHPLTKHCVSFVINGVQYV